MDVVSLESKNESEYFLNLCKRNARYIDDDFAHIGGMSLGQPTDDRYEQWYWVSSGARVDYPLSFGPNNPDNIGDDEYCLSVQKLPGNIFFFNDINCNGLYEVKFICQIVEVDNNVHVSVNPRMGQTEE